MDSSGSQRKRGGRLTKNANCSETSLENIEQNEAVEVSAISISPTLEESETATNAPVAECRRSSRKKIIKFDVRDLLNKNRKTHKIQIEARIDSNAPSTSKAANIGGIVAANSQASSSREDMLSKQKTFLEKSAIFRRYSISQDHKPPPPPLPIPPLLGKNNDGKDVTLSCSANPTRRLSRTQEFLSNVMIKPKQTTSLIVAQIESNKPCSLTTAKRKTSYKSTETRAVTLPEVKYPSVVQQKKRGRPAKIKTQASTLEESQKKKITPEKATNWKEYKACLSQQTIKSKNEKHSIQPTDEPLGPSSSHRYEELNLCKKEAVQCLEDIKHSGISRSDDDGNFSGFQTSKDEMGIKSAVKENILIKKDISRKKTLSTSESSENPSIQIKNIIEGKVIDSASLKSSEMETGMTKYEKNLSNISDMIEANHDEVKDVLLKPQKISTEETSQLNLDTITPVKIDLNNLATIKPEVSENIEIQQEVIYNVSEIENVNISPDFLEIQEIEINTDGSSMALITEEKNVQHNPNTENVESGNVQKEFSTSIRENKGSVNDNPIKQVRNKPWKFYNKGATVTESDESFILPSKTQVVVQELSVASRKELKELPEIKNKLKESHFSAKSEVLEDNNSPPTKETISDVLVSTNRMQQTRQTPLLSKEIKSFSRTSSSSESENASEHSSYSSEPFSTTSSSSGRSYKSGDKLRVSLKRISLPKSPSTSSQTSTSEELNKFNFIKRKPPMIKRSKRLQKSTLGNETVTDIIGESHNLIPSNDNKVEENIGYQIDKEQFSMNVEEIETEICYAPQTLNLEVNKSMELVQPGIAEAITQDSYESMASEIADSLSNESSSALDISAKKDVAKREALRNRDTISSFEKIDDIDNQKSKTEQRGYEKESDIIKEQDILLPNESDECKQEMHILENFQKIPIDVDISLKLETAAKTDPNENPAEKIKQKKEIKTRSANDSSEQLQNKSLVAEDESFNLQGEVETFIFSESATMQADHLTTDTIEESTSVECKENVMDAHPSERSESIIEGKESDDFTKDETNISIINEIANVDIDIEGKIQNECNENVALVSEEMGKDEENTNRIIIPNSIKSTKSDHEKGNSILNQERNTCIKELSIQSIERIDELMLNNDTTQEQFELSFHESHEGEISPRNVNVHSKNLVGDEVSESSFVNQAVQTSKSEERIIEKPVPKIVKFKIKMNTDETEIYKYKKYGKNASTSKEIKESIFTQETETQKEKLSSQKNESNVQSDSEEMLKNNQDEIGSNQNLAAIDYISETVHKPLSIESDNNRDMSAKVSIDKAEFQTQSSAQDKNIAVNCKDEVFPNDIISNAPNEDYIGNENLAKDQQTFNIKHKICTNFTNKSSLTIDENVSKNTEEERIPLTYNSSKLSLNSNENSEDLVTELPTTLIPEMVEKTIEPLLLNMDSSAKIEVETNLLDESQEVVKTSDKIKLQSESYISNTQQDSILQNNKEPILLTNPTMIKRRSRKARFKHLYEAEIDSETDSSNGKNTPVEEPTDHRPKIESETTCKETHQLLEPNASVCEDETKFENVEIREEHAIHQENSQANLLSSQIKNVSIETNTLLDILRTVQSNTEAALKATKSPTNIPTTDEEHPIDNVTKCEGDESLEAQSELKTKPSTGDTNESVSTVKKGNYSPERSDTPSPLTFKKITPSPTRSQSSSPLTLKKVTRRYERRSRRGEDSDHKTLEETFAEIAAQSSKAVLAAKVYDIGGEQATDKIDQEEFDDIDNALNVKEEQINENFEDLQNPNEIVDEKDIDTSLNISQDQIIFIPNEEESTQTEDVSEVEAPKVVPAKRGRKPKNRPLETSITISKETWEVKNSLQTTETTIAKKVETETETKQETEEIIKEETNNEDITIRSQRNNESPVSNQIIESSVHIINQQDDFKEFHNLQPTSTSALKSLEYLDECKSSKKSNKKRDIKTQMEEEPAFSNVTICIEKEEEGEARAHKQSTKKRDYSFSKFEAKAASKKLQKKTKNEEDDLINLHKEDISTKASATTPPSKRGRKPKNQQAETPQQITSSRKKNKKDTSVNIAEEDINMETIKDLESESDSVNASLDKSFDEKLAKKKRQKKLKEAFEAALADDIKKNKEIIQSENSNLVSDPSFGLKFFSDSPPVPLNTQSTFKEEVNEDVQLTCIKPVVTDEDPDPLKDIEKFIADGVNLLKKDYKMDEESVEDVIQSTSPKIKEILEEPPKDNRVEIKEVFNTFETPADTPINTPSVTPPPKSPTFAEFLTPDETAGVRRSHRIKLITKTPKALVGRGLVRDKERFSIKDDVETKTHYTLDDHLTDLAEVEAKNAKFLKEMEERLSNFQVIKENEYLCERVVSREARKMICDCFLTHEEEERGELGCGEDCLNRLLMIECGLECNVKERCTNKRFQKFLCSPCRVFRTEKKGFGIMADIEILPGEFIMEYVGEVIDTEEFEKRRIMYSQDKNRHYYFMALRSDAIIDATVKGNISRFINHSCDPNAETQKWTVNGELRIGFFSRKSIMPGEEITFNYQYQRYGREAQRCYCESANCRGWIGQEPTSDEGEQVDDEDDESEDDEEDTSNLLVQDDDDDSDASVADPEEVQKQLEMAAAQAEVELAPLQLLEEKAKHGEITAHAGKSIQDLNKSDHEEDSKSKFKKLLTKMAEKVAAKQKQNKREQKLQRKKKSKESSTELANKLRFLEDPDIEDEVEFLKECGLKNQSDTLRLSRLMVRAKLVQTRLNLLEILRKGDFPCRRLFLDYHGLRLLHGWMSEDVGNMQIRLSLLKTLETLPIANKTVLTDSKVMQVVRNWCGNNTNLSPNDDSSSSNSNSQDMLAHGSTAFEEGSEMAELQKLAVKLIATWDGLPEIFRIPKKERIEQMKEHEREADRQYAANSETQENTAATDRYRRDRFGRGLNAPNSAPSTSNRFIKPNSGNPHRPTTATPENIKNLSKTQRREMFAAKVARDEAEKRLAEERREFETKCRFFGLDPKKTRVQDIPFCVNPATGQWYSIERKPIITPPSYAHVQVPVKPKSTDPNDYQLPAICSTLPPQWKYAITTQGKIYYYHIKHRIPQWEPPSSAQLQQCDLEDRDDDSETELTTTAGEDSSDDDDDILIGMDAAQLKAYIDRKVEMRRQKRYQRLVDERAISPRREEDRIYNQLEVRKYKENKEKIRKRKEDIRRKRAEALRQTSANMCTLANVTDATTKKVNTENDEELGILPIQDYLLSSDEEIDLKAEVNSPLIDKIVEGDKIVDELDALQTKKQLKRALPPHRDLSESTTSSSSAPTTVSNAVTVKPEYKKRKMDKKEKRKPKEQDAKYRKNKEKFRCEIAGIIVHHLKPYFKETCTLGRIQSNEDFNHLARKLTHFVIIKELKYCESVGQTLVVTESVKSKSREFIKKYMAKYGDVYVKPTNDPDFKDIPFTL